MIFYPHITALSLLGLAWIISRKARKLPSKEKLIAKLRHIDSSKIGEFIPRNPDDDFIENDARFWELFGGRVGLNDRANNAVCLVQLSQHKLKDHEVPKGASDYLATRAVLIIWCVRIDVIEDVIRKLFLPKLPHICARFAAYLYWDMEMWHEAMCGT